MHSEFDAEFDWWYRSAYPKVARVVFLIVHDRGRAEDIAQDAFVQMLRHWATVRGYEQPDAWVRRVAIRIAVRQSTRERRRSGLERQALPAQPEERIPHPELTRAMRELSPMQRSAVVLYYWADEPVQEIARTLGVSESTIKQHLMRARSRLGVLLKDGGAHDGG